MIQQSVSFKKLQIRMKGVFRQIPPLELVEEVLKILHFNGLNDNRIFTKFDILKERFEEVVILVEPYYIPCKAKRFLYNLNETKQITILRHLIRAHKYDLNTQEKVINGVKTTTYQFKVFREYTDLSGDYVMEFN